MPSYGGVETAAHLPRNALHGAGAYVNLAGNFDDAHDPGCAFRWLR
jgi:hypothetical protein